MRRQRMDKVVNVPMPESMHEKIVDTAGRFNLTMAEVIRGCIQADIEKLIERENKRRKRQRSQ